MAAPIILYIDTTNKRLISSFLSTVNPFQGITLEAGDLVPVQLHFLQANPASGTSGQLPYSYIDPASVTPVSLAIGTIGEPPTAGTFTVSYGANTTSALAWDITSTALATALNALASIISAGGVLVTGNAGGPWRITFNTPGVISTQFTVDPGELAPTSQGIVAVAVTGSSGVKEVQTITLLASPAAFQNIWTATYGAITITRLQAGGSGLNEIQRITVPQGTYAGAFSLSFPISSPKSTGAIPYNASASAVQAALQALTTIGANNCVVTQSSQVSWDVTFVGSLAAAAQDLIAGVSTGLMMPQYLAGSISLNVQGIFDLLAGADSVEPTLQVQQGMTGSVNTVLQTTITVNNTLIVSDPAVPAPPAASIYGFVTIPAGSNTVAVAFPFTLGYIPSGVAVTFMMPNSSSAILGGNVDQSSITAAGCNVILDSVPTDATHTLIYITLL